MSMFCFLYPTTLVVGYYGMASEKFCSRVSVTPSVRPWRFPDDNFRMGWKIFFKLSYHKIQIKFKFQFDRIIGSKVMAVSRLKICKTWWGIHVQSTWLVNPSTLIVDQKWHWQVVVKFNRATKLNIQAMFRGGLLCSHSFGGKSYYIAILLEEGECHYIAIFPGGNPTI